MGTIRRVHKLANGLSQADSNQHVLIADGACDQCLVTSAWTVLEETGRSVMMVGAFAGRNTGESFREVHAACRLTDEHGKRVLGIACFALYDSNPAQSESLLSLHQSLANCSNGIDDRSRSKRDLDNRPGRQAARFGETTLGFFFDGSKCFFAVDFWRMAILSLPKV